MRVSVRGIVPHVAALAVIGGCIALSFWQVERAGTKRQLLADVESAATLTIAQAEPGTPLPSRVTGQGRFDDGRQVLLDNKPHNGRPGVHVLTPWLDADGRIFLVNRGWTAWLVRGDAMPNPRVPEDAGRIEGLLTSPPRVGFELGRVDPLDPDRWPNRMTYHDQQELAAVFGPRLQPQVIQLDPAHPAHLTGTEWPVVTFGPERHIGYAFQWGLMAAVVAAIWIGLTIRSRRPRRP